MCHVLVRDQRDAGAGMGMGAGPGGMAGSITGGMGGRPGMSAEDLAEEQGWVARMVHLFRAEALDVQFEVSRKRFGILDDAVLNGAGWWVAVANCEEVLCGGRGKDEVYVPTIDHFGDQFGEAIQSARTRRASPAPIASFHLYSGVAGLVGNRLAQPRHNTLQIHPPADLSPLQHRRVP